MNSWIAIFRRTTTGKGFIPEIDGLRFFAIMTVVIFHFHYLFSEAIGNQVTMDWADGDMTTAGWWFSRLDLGVKVFFAISGFILSIPFIQQYWFNGKSISIKEYFIRRLTRLEPPFIIAVTGFLVVHVIFLGEDLVALLPHYLVTLVYLHTVIYNEYSIINPVTWSLETEVQFYLLIPLLALVILKPIHKWKGILVLIFLFFASILTRGWIIKDGPYGMMANVAGYFSHFSVGMGFAYLFLVKGGWLKKKNLIWDMIGIASFLGLFIFYKPQSGFFNQVLFNGAIFILFMSTFKGSFFNWLFTRPLVYLIGGMCYTIYLLHLAFFGLIVKVAPSLFLFNHYSVNFIIHFILAFSLLMVVSSLFFILVEKPCMDKEWPKKLMKRIIANKV
jgi:peptidoglycan/LPS O-acetylase OafA/YrhL